MTSPDRDEGGALKQKRLRQAIQEAIAAIPVEGGVFTPLYPDTLGSRLSFALLQRIAEEAARVALSGDPRLQENGTSSGREGFSMSFGSKEKSLSAK
jgi:hypothetical protein